MLANNRRRKPTAWIVAALLMFGQALDVAQACLAPERPQMAFEQGDCHRPSNPNHCLQQCTAASQATAQAQVAIPAMHACEPLLVAPDAHAMRSPVRAGAPLRSAAAAPPLSIRYCSFLL
jgi:hypothetical protein